ncbi:MAG: hypothetical protein ACJ79D_11255 [Myxococcales bacterium]
MGATKVAALFLAGVAARGDMMTSWDFHADKVDDPPAGFSFGKTGQDENNYYVARANALEDNVRLYHVVRGKRSQFAGWNGKVAGQAWHALAVEARGNRFQVFFDGKAVIDARDDTFQDAGKVGVWTKADSVTWFSGLSLKPQQ